MNDGDLCDNCAGLAASGQYADIDALLRLLDEASWKPIETAPFDEQMTARERLAIVIAARLGDTSNMTNDAVSAVVAKELANWAPIK